MKFLPGKKKIHITLVLAMVSSLLFIHITKAVTAEPGTPEDPIVSQSYVDGKIDTLSRELLNLKQQVSSLQTNQSTEVSQLKEKVSSFEKDLIDLQQQIQNDVSVQGQKFEIIGPVEPGKLIIAGESTEIMLRSGSATAIASEKGGIIDLITGGDIQTGGNVPLNHLLLIPRNDGRGLTVTKEAWILIKGSYTLK